MDYGRLLMFWDQRIVLLTAILNLTKQMEAQSSQKDIQLGDLPEQRQVYIDRLKKCNRMIDVCQNKAKEDELARLEQLLSGKGGVEPRTPEERRLADYAQKSRCLLDSILASDVEAQRKIRIECDRLQKLMRSARQKAGGTANLQNP